MFGFFFHEEGLFESWSMFGGLQSWDPERKSECDQTNFCRAEIDGVHL